MPSTVKKQLGERKKNQINQRKIKYISIKKKISREYHRYLGGY